MKSLSLLLFALFLYSGINAQDKKSKAPAPSSTTRKVTLPFEKVYLHLDRSSYSTGDDIWFKAYLVDAVSTTLFDNSNLLYAELISPDSKIIQREMVQLIQGAGNGDFHLKDSLPSGKYQIRAYTNWMRNFGDAFIFKKEIQIENFLSSKANSKTPIVAVTPKIDVQFFPEGGSLVEDVYSNIAFKAIDQEGKGCEISGSIHTSSGDSVNYFKSVHLGMGSFNFIPQSGVTYYAEGRTSSGLSFKVQLPVASKTGYTFKVADLDENNLRVTIRTNKETLTLRPNEDLLIAGTAHGVLCASASLKMKNVLVNVVLPKKDFSEGIARLTLYNNDYKPYGERLVYIHRNAPIKVMVTPGKQVYAPREKVTLQVSVKDSANNPIPANLSLAVVDASLIKDSLDYGTSIASYFLLESELRGNIEHPGYYFANNNPDRKKALDLLLQTQGWRDFLWKYMADTTVKLTYEIEKGISIKGNLRKLLINKPLINANISLGIFGNTNFMAIAQTDSLGKFAFRDINITGQNTMILTATNKDHNTRGWLQLDSLKQKPVPVTFHWMETLAKIMPEEALFKQEAGLRNNQLKKYRLSDTIALNEVVVNARRNLEKKDDGHTRIYGTADYVLEVTDQNAGATDIFQLIQGRVAGLMISGTYPNISFSMRGSHGTPLFLLDGMPVDIDMIGTLQVSEVDKIEVLKDIGNLAMFGSRGGNGVISVFTKNGYVATAKPVFHSINTKINGYYQSRVFYSPKYDVPQTESLKPDLRTTIFWAPNITTDDNGGGSVSFFNGDKAAPVAIKAEGLTQSGIPISIKSTYIVK